MGKGCYPRVTYARADIVVYRFVTNVRGMFSAVGPKFVPFSQDLVESWADVVVVGSGLYGLTAAEIISRKFKKKVLIIDRRLHIGGNAYSFFDQETGIEIHKYGSHLFHTSNPKVIDYVSRFTELNSYRHRVLTVSRNQVYSMPINLMTINNFFGKTFSPNEARDFIAQRARLESARESLGSLQGKCISLIGKDLYEAFIKGYTLKQWQTDPNLLPAEVISRLPVRFNYNDRYFQDIWEGLPTLGYEAWFLKMIENNQIRISLGMDYFEIRDYLTAKKVIFTGPVDQFFDYNEGELAWRTLDFEQEKLEIQDFQGTSVMNYADEDVPYTRIHEFKHLHPERNHQLGTIIMREFSRKAHRRDEPYYPVNSPEDREILRKYRKQSEVVPNVHFGGRLGTYQYLDMHMAIASAITWVHNHFDYWFNREGAA
jgi:UDP-galactopyranose mutase